MIRAPSHGTSGTWNSRPIERSVCFRDAPCRMLLRPMDTNRLDCARAGEDMATSRARAGLCARIAQASAQQNYRSTSPTTLAREIQSGNSLSWNQNSPAQVHSTILVIPSEVEESLDILNRRAGAFIQIRDVSAPLDMTNHGRDASRSSVSRNWIDRVSLFVG